MLLVLAQAAASPTRSPTPPDITITAREERRRIVDLVEALVRGDSQTQLARFEDAVCPGVAGARRALAEPLLLMVRDNMAAAGARLAPEGCRVNALIAFSSDPGALATSIFQKRVGTGRSMSRIRRERLLAGDDAIRSWQLAQPRAADGTTIPGDVTQPANVRNPFSMRLRRSIRQEAYLSIALIDTRRAQGKMVRQLADVSTMHLLLNLLPGASQKAGASILTLFDSASPPPAMTAFDRGLLKGLYQPQSNAEHGRIQRQRMARSVRREQAEAKE